MLGLTDLGFKAILLSSWRRCGINWMAVTVCHSLTFGHEVHGEVAQFELALLFFCHIVKKECQNLHDKLKDSDC